MSRLSLLIRLLTSVESGVMERTKLRYTSCFINSLLLLNMISAPACFNLSAGRGDLFRTAQQKSPAALADRIPKGAFSTTQQFDSGNSSLLTASSYGSGAGCPSFVSRPVTVRLNKLRRSLSDSNICLRLSDPVTKPSAMCFSARAVKSSRVQGNSRG